MQAYLEFEKPIAELDGKVRELRTLNESGQNINMGDEIARLETKARQALCEIYKKLDPWQKTQVARHPDRPHFRDYVDALITDFQSLAGDRGFADDQAIQAGLGRFDGQSVAIIGHEKGYDTQTRLYHNFGMAKPEGYRKAIRIMELAEQFQLPLLSFVDTAGAYPGIGAEERGQAEAIARSIESCLNLSIPTISVIIGEGGSGGAMGIAATSRVYMLSHSIYCVISPEGAASILWHDATRAPEAATSMKITAQDLKQFGVIDDIIDEPAGGAHRNKTAVFTSTAALLSDALSELSQKSEADLVSERRAKFLRMGRNL